MILTIKGSLTDLNTYIKAERANKFMGANVKKKETLQVYAACKEQKLKPFKGKIVEIIFSWYCQNKKKDKDNIAFSKKFIMDGLILAKVLKNDGWKAYDSFSDRFYVDSENPRIEVELI